jgi:hypothetical protein
LFSHLTDVKVGEIDVRYRTRDEGSRRLLY